MRIALRVAIGVGVLLVVVLGALALLLPRIAGSPAVRARIEQQAEQALGREFTYDDLSVGLLPPELVVANVRVAADDPEQPPFAEAEQIGLRALLWPLFAGQLVVDSVVVESATLRLVRTEEGIELPAPKPEAAEEAVRREAEEAPPPEAAEEAPPPEAAEEGRPPLAIAVREARLVSSRILLTDRTLQPPAEWDLKDVDAKVRLDSLEAPIPFELSAELASGGLLRAEGRVSADGPIDASVDLDSIVLDPAAPYAGADVKLAGRLSGSIRAKGPTPENADVTADLQIEDADVKLQDMVLRGNVSAKADLKGAAAGTGTFQIDATQAELAYGESFRKPSGTRATASGRLVSKGDGRFGVEGVRLRMRNLEATGSASIGDRTQVELDAPPFELAGWEEMLPALSGYDLAGPLAFEGLRAATSPLEVHGRIAVRGVRAKVPDAGVVQARGTIEGIGKALRLQDLELDLAGQPLRLAGTVSELDGPLRYDVQARTRNAGTNAMLSSFTTLTDTLFGPLDLDADLAGTFAGDTEPIQAASGRVRMDISCAEEVADGRVEPCRLRGVSILRSTFQQLASVSEAAIVLSRLRGGDTLDRFYEDRFRLISGTLRIANGVASTDDLRIEYRHYAVDLRGDVGLLDYRLDATGQLTIYDELDEALGGSGRDARVIPLARVTGTVADPRVDLSPRAVTRFAAAYALGREREKLRSKIEEELGEEAGGEVIDVLEGILGGRKR